VKPTQYALLAVDMATGKANGFRWVFSADDALSIRGDVRSGRKRPDETPSGWKRRTVGFWLLRRKHVDPEYRTDDCRHEDNWEMGGYES